MNKAVNLMNASDKGKDYLIPSMPGFAWFFPIINKDLNTSDNNLFWLCIYSILYMYLKKNEQATFLDLVAKFKMTYSACIVEESDDFSKLIQSLTAQQLLQILINKDSKVRDLISNNIITEKLSEAPYQNYSLIIAKQANTLQIRINLINVITHKTDKYDPEGNAPITNTITLISNNVNVGMVITIEDYLLLYPKKIPAAVGPELPAINQSSTISHAKNIDNILSNNASKVDKLKNPDITIQNCNNTCGIHYKPMLFYCPECRAWRCEDCHDIHAVITPGTIASWREVPMSTTSSAVVDPKLLEEALHKLEETYNTINSKIETQLLQSMQAMNIIFKEERTEEEWTDQMAKQGISEQHLLLIDRINCAEISEEKKLFEAEIDQRRNQIDAAVKQFNVKINKRAEVEALIEKEMTLSKIN